MAPSPKLSRLSATFRAAKFALLLAFAVPTLRAQEDSLDPASLMSEDFRVFIDVADLSPFLRLAASDALWNGAPAGARAALEPLDRLAALKPGRAVFGGELGSNKPWMLLVSAADRDGTAKLLKELVRSPKAVPVKVGAFAGLCDGPETLKSFRDLAAGKGKALADKTLLREARARNRESSALLHVDLSGTKWLRGGVGKAKDAGQALLGAHVLFAAATADEIELRIDLVPGRGLTARAAAPIASMPAERRFAVPVEEAANSLLLPLAQPPGGALWLRLRRDVAAFWERKDSFIAEDARPATAEFQNNLSILLGGLAAEEVFAGLGSEYDFYVGPPPKLEPAPQTRFPTAALVARVRDAALRTEILLGFQTTLGIVNAQAAMNRKPRYLIESAERRGVRISYARVLPEQLYDREDPRVQLQPALAFVGERMIFGTHPDLVGALVEQAADDRTAPLPVGDSLRLDGPAAAALLLAAKSYLAAEESAKSGASLADAEAGVRFAAALLGRLPSAAMDLAFVERRATLALELQAPTLVPSNEPPK